MTRKHLQWSDVSPTLLRAVGRSGVEYRIEQTESGRWMLTRFETPVDPGMDVTSGWLVDMKAIAEEQESDALGPPPAAQRIAWTKIKPGHYWGTAPVGLAYRITKIGRIDCETLWRLERCANADAEHTATILDEGALATLKRHAVDDATAAAKDRSTLEAA